MKDWNSLGDLANELKMHKANVHKLVKKLGIGTRLVRDPKKKNQKIAVIDADGVQKLRSYRSEFGEVITKPVSGVFYLIQLIPEVLPERIKMGYTTELTTRLRDFRTTCPGLSVTKTWPCPVPGIEVTAILVAITKRDKRLSSEVFDVENLDKTTARLDRLFGSIDEFKASCEV